MFDITVILLLLVAAVASTAAYFGKKYVTPILKQQLTIEERQNLYDAVVIGVAAAEQLLKEGKIGKDERTQKVLEYLEKNNITYDEEVVMYMIKAAVLDLPKTFLGLDEDAKE